MTCEQLTKRGQKAQITKSKLIASALDLFSRQGYENTTIKEIAHEAGVSLGLLYNYFSSKDDLLRQIIAQETFLPTLSKMLEEEADLDVKTLFSNIAHRFYEFTGQQSPIIRLFFMEMIKNPEVTAIFSDFVYKERLFFRNHLKEKIASHELRQHNVEVSIHILIHTVITMRLHEAVVTDPDDFLNSLVDILMYGIAEK